MAHGLISARVQITGKCLETSRINAMHPVYQNEPDSRGSSRGMTEDGVGGRVSGRAAPTGAPVRQPPHRSGPVDSTAAVSPPSTGRMVPVTKPASSESRKAITAAASSGRP